MLSLIDFCIIVILTINIFSFALMGFDKRQAIASATRISEFFLLVLGVLGGSLGILLGVHFFRHKSKKSSFQVQLVLIILVQLTLAFYLKLHNY